MYNDDDDHESSLMNHVNTEIRKIVLRSRDVNLGVFLLSRDNQILKYTVSR